MAWLAGAANRLNGLLDSMDQVAESVATDVKTTVTGNTPVKGSSSATAAAADGSEATPERYVSRRVRQTLDESLAESPMGDERVVTMYYEEEEEEEEVRGSPTDEWDDDDDADEGYEEETEVDWSESLGKPCRIQAGGGGWVSGTIIELNGALATVDLGDGETDMLELGTPDIEVLDVVAPGAPAAAPGASASASTSAHASSDGDELAAQEAKSLAFAAEVYGAAEKNGRGELTHATLIEYCDRNRAARTHLFGEHDEWRTVFGDVLGAEDGEGEAWWAFSEAEWTSFVQKRDFAEKLFDAANKNHDSFLTHSELRKYCKRHHEEKLKLLGADFAWQAIFAEIGTKESGRFDFEEFAVFALMHDVRQTVAARRDSMAVETVPTAAAAAAVAAAQVERTKYEVAEEMGTMKEAAATQSAAAPEVDADVAVEVQATEEVVAADQTTSFAFERPASATSATGAASTRVTPLSSQADLDKLRAQNGRLKLSKEGLTSTLNVLRCEMDKCLSECESLKSLNVKLKAKEKRLDAELNELDESIVKMQARAEAAEAQVRSAGGTEEEAAQREASLLQKLHKLETANKHLAVEVKELQTECDNVGDEAATASEKAAEFEEESERLAEECVRLNAEVEALKKLTDGATENSAKSEGVVSALRASCDDANDRVKSLQAQLVALQQSTHVAGQEHARIQKEAEQRVRNLEEAHADLGETLARARRKCV